MSTTHSLHLEMNLKNPVLRKACILKANVDNYEYANNLKNFSKAKFNIAG